MRIYESMRMIRIIYGESIHSHNSHDYSHHSYREDGLISQLTAGQSCGMVFKHFIHWRYDIFHADLIAFNS